MLTTHMTSEAKTRFSLLEPPSDGPVVKASQLNALIRDAYANARTRQRNNDAITMLDDAACGADFGWERC